MCRSLARVRTAGLSPRVRGNPETLTLAEWPERSIPAGAGEPATSLGFDYASMVYPRGCGGTPMHTTHLKANQGLSPRVRGNPHLLTAHSLAPRSIPAGAGEPRRRRDLLRRDAVYPRGCGGTIAIHWGANEAVGLSPRVRGNLCGRWFPLKSLRSIPAGAGEPLPYIGAQMRQ